MGSPGDSSGSDDRLGAVGGGHETGALRGERVRAGFNPAERVSALFVGTRIEHGIRRAAQHHRRFGDRLTRGVVHHLAFHRRLGLEASTV